MHESVKLDFHNAFMLPARVQASLGYTFNFKSRQILKRFFANWVDNFGTLYHTTRKGSYLNKRFCKQFSEFLLLAWAAGPLQYNCVTLVLGIDFFKMLTWPACLIYVHFEG